MKAKGGEFLERTGFSRAKDAGLYCAAPFRGDRIVGTGPVLPLLALVFLPAVPGAAGPVSYTHLTLPTKA